MAAVLGHGESSRTVTGKYRVGDIRHCFADITRAREVLGYEPQVTLDEGLVELAGGSRARWPTTASPSTAELAARGLTV